MTNKPELTDELHYGDNVLWFLNELASFEPDDIDYNDFDVYGEHESGAEGTASVGIVELAADAVKLITKLQAELQERRKPVITFYSEGIAAAANWVDQQRESYDNEHGRRDNDTGSFEFGNDAQRDYSDTLSEIAEGIRALHPSTSEQERRKADSEPVGWTDEEELRDVEKDGCGYLFKANPISPNSDPRRVIKLYRHAQPVQEREQIRREHAVWSQATFGDVGPVGPLKHLSKEALEAAAEPGDLSEWADMQFLLWDAQRRAGISDEQIILAMVEKLAVNKQREWPEPKDGEPRLHIKTEQHQGEK